MILMILFSKKIIVIKYFYNIRNITSEFICLGIFLSFFYHFSNIYIPMNFKI